MAEYSLSLPLPGKSARPRFVTCTVSGHCLGRRVFEGWHLIGDRNADLRFGDIVMLGVGSEREAKIFVGQVEERIEVVMLEPVRSFTVKLSVLDLLCRVRAITPYRWRVPTLKAGIRLFGREYDHRLGAIAAQVAGKELVCLKP